MNLLNNENLNSDNPESRMIPLGYNDDNGNPAMWNLDTQQTEIVTPEKFDKASMFASLVEHAENNSEEIEWCAYDLSHDMFSDKEAHPDRVARDLEQAWKLSLFLGREVAKRVTNNAGGKTVIILINDSDNLFRISNPEQTDLYMDIHDSLKSIISVGQQVGMHLLMQSQSATLKAPELKPL